MYTWRGAGAWPEKDGRLVRTPPAGKAWHGPLGQGRQNVAGGLYVEGGTWLGLGLELGLGLGLGLGCTWRAAR